MSFNLFHNLPELARNGGFTLCDGADENDGTIDWRFIGKLQVRLARRVKIIFSIFHSFN